MDRLERTKDFPAYVRSFTGRDDYERMVDYFLGADAAFLHGMGVDPAKLPQREDWLDAAMRDHGRPDRQRQRFYLAWIHDGMPVGHSSVNKIAIGEEAFIHLHLWDAALRKLGLGTEFFKASAQEFVRALHLKRVYCEPYAENPAPNRVLAKCGFRFVKRYRTVPGDINFEQDVNQYVLDVPAAGAGDAPAPVG
jgi:RimJ/RimL family protein N-acetyltransferase